MGYFKPIIFLIALLCAYLIIINIASMIDFSKPIDQNTTITEGGPTQVGMSDQADISIKRTRWYGTINEDYSKEYSRSVVHVGNIIPIPIKINNINLIWIHIFMVFVVVIYLFYLWIDNGGEDEYND